MGFAEDMAELEQEWDAAPKERDGDFGPTIPDGQHQVIVVEADVRQRQSDEHWQLFLKFQNRLGTIRKWSDLDHEIGLKVARQDAYTLGYDGNLAGLEKACAEFVGLVCDINVQTKPGDSRDFTNVYLNRCHGKAADPAMFDVDPAAAPQEEPVASAADDDIPF